MLKISRNKKLNSVLNTIYDELNDLGVEEIKRYYNEFRHETDYNLYQYGNLRIYYDDIRDLYKEYKSLKKASNEKIEKIYKQQIKFVVNHCFIKNDYELYY